MKKLEIVNSVSRTFNKVGFGIKKHSPEILIVAGVIGTVTSAVMACKATTKLGGIVDAAKADIDTIHKCAENPEACIKEGETYTLEDSKKDLAIVYAKTGVKLVKLYGPAVMLGTLSLTGIITSNHILRKRNVALAAAYATVDKGFKEYRGRVIERFGKDLDRELKYNIKAKEIEEIVVDENGKEKIEKKTVEVANIEGYGVSEYARYFDETCTAWCKNAEYNLTFLKAQQAWANKKLKEQGYLFLNDVYETLGLQKTKAGQAVGWVYDEKNPVGDNFVDFGIYNLYRDAARRFVNGYERSILLDFNVDGVIWDLMP
jgi:hypothetical protein